ncbi:Flagellar biosynthesis protein FliO [Salinisphaera sp. PC39]|uniref:flagellar biosynthetic protein FliO n=1 Tax=Salinisphaera sp. PC39 TaxID=1304156 RepID=UPI003342A144
MTSRAVLALTVLAAAPAALAAPAAGARWLDIALAVAAGVLLLLAVWLFLRQRGRGARRRGPVELLQELDIGGRERLLLVRVSGEYLLLGATQERISLLRQLERAPVQPAAADEKPREPTL